jgi:hypothetical protein
VKRVIKGMVFEDGEGNADKFVKDSEEDNHLGFAIGFKAVSKGFEPWIFMAGDDSGHVEDAAEMAVALAANGGGVTDRGTAFVFARGDTDPSGCGPGAMEMAWQFGTEPAGGLWANAGDLLEKGALIAQEGMFTQVRGDGLFKELLFSHERTFYATQTLKKHGFP